MKIVIVIRILTAVVVIEKDERLAVCFVAVQPCDIAIARPVRANIGKAFKIF